MKAYPSIASSTGKSFRAFEAHVFDKLDGSNLRWEWSPKRGWYKFGTRHRLFDETDEVFGCAVEIFRKEFAEPLEEFARRERWQGCVAFTEFWGENSFAGLHDPKEEKNLSLIDLAVYKMGLMDPREFVELGAIVPTASYLGKFNWTRGFVERVRSGEVDGVTFEGVVGKLMVGRKSVMAKAKTSAWIDKVRALYASDEAERIIRS